MTETQTKACRVFEHVNLWDIAQDGTLTGCSGEAGFLYKLHPLKDVTLLHDGAQQNWVKGTRGLLEALPPNAALSFCVDIDAGKNEATELLEGKLRDGSPFLKDVVRSKMSLLGATQRTRASFMCLSFHAANFLKLPLFVKIAAPQLLSFAIIRDRFERLKASLVNTDGLLTGLGPGLGVRFEKLGRSETLGYYWKKLNPAKAKEGVNAPEMKPYLTLRSQLGMSPAREEMDHLWLDGFYHRTISLYALGEFIELGGMDKLISSLPQGCSLVLNFMSLDLEAALERAKNMARKSAGLSFLQGTKNYEAVARGAELDELITLVRSKGERLYLFSMIAVVRDAGAEGIRDKSLKVHQLIRECLGAEALIEDLNHKRLFCASLPLGPHIAPRRHTLTGEACAHIAPLSAPWTGTASRESGMMLKSRDGEIVTIDPFDGGSPRHGIVIGSTGSGKSFTMNYLVESMFALDSTTSFVIVDIGGSYKRLCEVLGGDYFELRLSEEFAINPFPSPAAIAEGQDGLDPDLLGYLCLLVEKMLDGKSDQNKRRLIETGIKKLYSQNRQAETAPLLNEFRTVLETLGGDNADRADAADMARNLKFYTDGIYGKLLNRPSVLKPFEGRMTVFDLAGLKEHKGLQAILVFLIGFGLGRKMKDRSAKKIVILDEAWEFFNDPIASELISRLYRTARKFNGMILSVSQSPIDFLKSAASTAILANSYWKIFLRLDMGHEELPAFGLNSRQVDAVRSLSMKRRCYSEMLLVFGENSRVLRIQPSSLEYWIATTNAEECAMEAILAATHRGDRFSLIKTLAEKEPVYAA